MPGKVPMTRQGYEALVNELKHLRAVVRPQVINAVRTARAEGDLSENAEYHGARERQALIEAKIRHLEAQLADAEVIDTTTLGGERVVFGAGALAEVPISQAIAASSAIPGFFEPYTIGGRDYVDGGVGHVAHADLAVDREATLVLVMNPQVPLMADEGAGARHLKERGLYLIMEQSSRIASQNLLELGLRELRARHPKTEIFLLQPDRRERLLFGPSMGFEASRAALRYGYASTLEWLGRDGATFSRRFGAGAEVAQSPA